MGALTGDTYVVRPAAEVAGELSVPGDKAISHRAILIGAGCEGSVAIRGLSSALDVRTTLRSARTLGSKTLNPPTNSQVESFQASSEDGFTLKLEGRRNWQDWSPTREIDCENSGTTMRLLMGILAGSPGSFRLTGDASLSRRPMGRVAEPLRLMGAGISLREGGLPPVAITGGPLEGITYELPVASAQVKSAILLAGLRARGETAVVEPVPTRDHTERLLRFLGCEVTSGASVGVEPTQLFGDKEINIPGDFSSASFLLTAAAVSKLGDVTITGVGLNPTRTAFLSVLERFGAQISTGGIHEVSGEPRGWVRARSGDRRPVWVEEAEIPACIDELPLVAVLAAFAEGTTEVRGAAELRVKESDRVASIVEGLRGLGVEARALPDGFVVEGGRPAGGRAGSFGDHRIAMALAVAGLGASGETVIDGWGAVGVSYPEFASHLELVAGRA